jgi:hypothetical protein
MVEAAEEGAKITDPFEGIRSREDRLEEAKAEAAARLTAENINSKLVPLLTYLRERHRYCLYCSIAFESDEDLQRSCPGGLRPEHDDLDDDLDGN